VLWVPVTTDHVRHMAPLTRRETWVLVGFAVAVLGIGIWPQPLVHLMDSSVTQLVSQLAVHKI